jgi:hypothetical protein
MGEGGLKGCFENFKGHIWKSNKREENMKKKKKRFWIPNRKSTS